MLVGKRGFAAVGVLLVAAHTLAAAPAANVSIQYSLVPLGGNVYRYVYTITNTGPGATVQLFDILFDTSLYQQSSLQIVSPGSISSAWTQQILLALPGVPAAYDNLALTGGIPPGSTVSGFAVQFTWLGPGTPGSQPFQIFDPNTFNLLESGNTVTPTSVPTVSTSALLILGLGLGIASAYQARLQNPCRVTR